ncbi:FKBP-type peptidyl-prolyl cis-trans isomerase [Micromonospora sp. NPDC002389]|uniref:FKBP-type peptidyl-prolyl cis-trans isomerase n=1 Tax=Micromonospora sp. NPDC002389 TaxID=3154272 RepID=UPI00331A3026
MSEQETKARRRLAEQLAAQKAAEAKRRRQAWAGGLAGIAVVAVLVTVFVIVGQRGGDDAPDEFASSPSAPADAPADPGAPGAPPAPQLPEGADPALGTKPTVSAGEGELTKLTVTPLIEGTGPAVTAGQSITTNYVGVLFANGEQFDSSWDRGEPATFPIGVGQVIEGWDKGLVGVKVGSRVQLDIPAEQAYGTDGAGGRPAGPLRFVVDILAAQ